MRNANRNRGLAALILAFCVFLLSGAARGDDYLSVRGLAESYKLSYEDISQGSMRGCRLDGDGRSVTVFAGLRSILIDGSVVQLSRPAQWDGRTVLIPSEAAALFVRKFGTPPTQVNPVPAPKVVLPNRTFKVVIDAGHGGRDPGAIGPTGLYEKVVNLDVATRLARHLRSRGVRVILTRTRDMHLARTHKEDLRKRAAIANREQPDLFMSIHANAEVTRTQHGAMSLYPDEVTLSKAMSDVKTNGARALSPRKLGAGGMVGDRAMLAVAGATFESYRARSKRAAATIQKALAPVTGCVPRANGVIEDFRGLHVLRNVRAPAVLVEVDFVSNRSSERKLRKAAYRESIAKAIAAAVEKFLKATAAEDAG